MTVTDSAQAHTQTSPLGPITLWANHEAVVALTIHREDEGVSPNPAAAAHPVLAQASRELSEYFAGTRTHFETPVQPQGTAFQEASWRALEDIDFGTTITYGELGKRAGVGNAPRAVGGAVGSNPIPILIGCHRVLGASGRITGYSGGNGISTKEILLRLEGIPYRD